MQNNQNSSSHRNVACVGLNAVNAKSTAAQLTQLSIGPESNNRVYDSNAVASFEETVSFLASGTYTIFLVDAYPPKANGFLRTFVMQGSGMVTIFPVTPGVSMSVNLTTANQCVTYMWCGLPIGWTIFASPFSAGPPPVPTFIGVSGQITNPVGNIPSALETQLQLMDTLTESWFFNTNPLDFDDLNGNYVAPITGYYLLQARVTFDNTGAHGGSRSVFALLNANPLLVLESADVQASANEAISSDVQFSGVCLLAAGSVVSFWVYQDSGVPITLLSTPAVDSGRNRFCVWSMN